MAVPHAPLAGRNALVIGGSRGIGAAIVGRLAADGADVALTYAGSATAAAAVAADAQAGGRTALALQADSGDETALAAAVDDAAEALGSVDILVYNAGVLLLGQIDTQPVADLDRSYAINVRGAFVAIQAALRHMPDGGRIVIIGSNVAGRVASPGSAAYAMTKSAVATMARAIARDLAPRGITINIVQPGPTATDMNPVDGPFAETIRGMIPLGRFGDTSEIAALVAHLAGPEAGFMTGAAVTIDGGYSI